MSTTILNDKNRASDPLTLDFVQAERERLRSGQLDAEAIVGIAEIEALERMPSPDMDSVSTESLLAFSELWLARHRSIVRSLGIGTVLAVDLGSGMYVTATSTLVAMDRFEEAFSTERAAWVHEVGVPVTLGGGLWALRSEA